MHAFEGIKVIDFTHVLAGPFCSYQLAVMGADVIKIEAPASPDMMRPEGLSASLAQRGLGTHFLSQGGNKRSLAVDLGSAEGRQLVHELIKGADVLVENFRLGVLDRIGLGYEQLASDNPALVYCSITGFGHSGPKASHPAYDNVIQAFSGLMAHTGSSDTAPVRVGPPVLDYGTGAQAAFAIAAALFQRCRTGRGQQIDVSMLDAALMLMTTSVVDTQASGEAPVPPGNSSLTRAGYGCFETVDGLIMIGAFTARQHARLWAALGHSDEAAIVAELDSAALAARVGDDRSRLATLLAGSPAQHWEDLLNAAGVPAARVRQLDETLQHPQLASRGVLQSAGMETPGHDSLQTPVAAFGYRDNGPQLDTPAATLGQHSIEVLEELGIERQRIDELLASGVIGSASS